MEVYLDCAATTKIDSGVLEKTREFNKKYFANPSSQHKLGREVREKIDDARKKIADFINAEPEEIIFTSGGTESNNLAIKGLALANPDKRHIITSSIEHPALIETCRAMEKQGYTVDYIKVNNEGIVDIEEIKKRIRNDTLVVSIMHVNNEIGTIQPVEEIAEICKNKEVYFHTDAVQSFTKIPFDVKKTNIDLMSVSGHKIHGPKGIGFLYIKLGTRIKPIIDGGGQEFKLRSGTENISGIIAFSSAIDLKDDSERLKGLQNYLFDGLQKIRGLRINGSVEKRIYNNVNVSFYGIEGEGLLLLLEENNIFTSTGSACASHNLEESHVLKAINADEMYIHGSIRMTYDNDFDVEKAKYVIEKIKESVTKLQNTSPFKLGGENEKDN